MTEQEYGEAFGWANLVVETLWPEVHEDALVVDVEDNPGEPNLVFTLRVFDAKGPVGDPIVKMIAKAAVLDELRSRRARMQHLAYGQEQAA
jgi:hypothetical protein